MGRVLRFCIGLWAALVWAGPALAQPADVTLELVAPLNHPGAVVTGATLLSGGANGTVVGSFVGYLFASGATARQIFPVSDLPDALRLEFEVPSGGLSTTLVVDPLSSPDEFFLPNPSLGVEITSPPPPPGDPGVDAVVRVSIADVTGVDDDEAPSCEITRDGATLEAVVQDTESGLAEIDVREERNLVVTEPSFPPETTDPVTVSAVVEDVERTATLLLAIVDVAGNRRYCKSITLSGDEGSSPDPGAGGAGDISGNQVPSLSPLGLLLLGSLVGAGALHSLRRS